MSYPTEILCQKIYQYLFSKRIFYKTGHYGKQIKNWDNIKTKEEWPYIERLAHLIEQSSGQIDYKLLIDALFDFTNNSWFNPKLLCSPKGIAIYKNYIKKLADAVNPESIKKEIIKSVKFIIRFCKANNIKNFSDYFNHNNLIFPTIIKHLESGVISKQFFELIPNIEKKILNFPSDIYYDYFKGKEEEMIINRKLNLTRSPWIRNFAMNFDLLFETKLN